MLGETNEVMKFDKLRTNLRNLGTTLAKENYEVSLAAIQTRVLAKNSTLKQQFKEWKRCFFAKHNCNEPNLEDIRDGKTAHDLEAVQATIEVLEHYSTFVKLRKIPLFGQMYMHHINL